MTRILPLLLALPALASCQAQGEPLTPEAELKLLAGEWKLVATEQAGKKIENSDQTLEIDGTKCTNTTTPTGKAAVVLKSTIKIDPSKAPKQIEVTFSPLTASADLVTFSGIYEVTADRFCILYYDPAKPPPAGFGTKGTDNLLFTYERVKPKQ